MKEGKSRTHRPKSAILRNAAEPSSYHDTPGTASLMPPVQTSLAPNGSQQQSAASSLESIGPLPNPPRLFYGMVRQGGGAGETYAVSSTDTSLELIAQQVYQSPEKALPSLVSLNQKEAQEIIPNNRIIRLKQNAPPTPATRKLVFGGAPIFEDGVKRNPITVLSQMGINSAAEAVAKKSAMDRTLKNKFPIAKIAIQSGAQDIALGILEALAKDRYTRYPGKYPAGGEYFKKMLTQLRMATTTFKGDFGVSQWTNHYSMIFNRFSKRNKEKLRFLISMYAPEYVGDEGTKEVTYAGAVKDTIKDYASQAFYWACEQLDINPNEIKNFFSKVGAGISKVILHPIDFISNLGKSVKGGLARFTENIKQNIIGGVKTWISNQLGGLSLPGELSFTPKGLMELALHVTGFTKENIRAQVAAVVGEETLQKAEKRVDVIKQVFQEGPGVLWEMLQEKAAEIKSGFIAQLKSWAMRELITKGIKHLVSFLIPGGGVIKAVKAIWNMIEWVRNNLKRMMTFVKTVMNSIKDIAAGNISGAVSFINNSLIQAVPLVIDLLARVLKIDGMVDTIKDIVNNKLKAPVNAAIQKVVGFLVGKARAIGGKIKTTAAGVKEKIANWWQLKKGFVQDGISHTLLFKGKGPSAELMVHSVERPLDNYLTLMQQQLAGHPEYASLYKPSLEQINGYQSKIEAIKSKKDSLTKEEGQKIKSYLQAMARYLGRLPDLDLTISEQNGEDTGEVDTEKLSARPKSKIDYGGTHPSTFQGLNGNQVKSADGQQVNADLSINPGNHVGVSTVKKSPMLHELYKRPYVYVGGHILNHHLYGNGSDSRNIAPITYQANSDMKHGVESKLKQLVFQQNKVVHFQAEVDYRQGTSEEIPLPVEAHTPYSLDFQLQERTFQPPAGTADKEALAKEMKKLSNWKANGPSHAYQVKSDNSPYLHSKLDSISISPVQATVGQFMKAGLGERLARRIVFKREKNPWVRTIEQFNQLMTDDPEFLSPHEIEQLSAASQNLMNAGF